MHKSRNAKKVEYRITETNCHEVISHKPIRYGYAQITRNGRRTAAYRLAWESGNGPIPPGIEVCHVCDNPACINLEHLFLGTQKDNMQDMTEKGRRVKGEKHGQSKLTQDQVEEIRTLFGDGVPQKQIARQYGVAQQTVSAVCTRRNWRHVK